MGTIHYTRTEFIKPWLVSEEEYRMMKSLIDKGVQSIDPSPQTFLNKFGNTLKWMVGLFGLAVFIFSVAEDGTWPIAIGGFSMMGFLMLGISIMLEGPSYAMYVKKRTKYYQELFILIKDSNSYEEFRAKYPSI